MRRGEIWIVAGGPGYMGKPRPAAIIQDDVFVDTPSVTICPISTFDKKTPLIRVTVEPSEATGLRVRSHLMVDKIATVPRERCQSLLGHLPSTDIVRLNRALAVFLGIAAARG